MILAAMTHPSLITTSLKKSISQIRRQNEEPNRTKHRSIPSSLGYNLKLLARLPLNPWFNRRWRIWLRNSEKVSAGDLAAWAVAVVSILGGMASYTQFMIKHYLKELKPNGGSSMNDQVNRLEARVDTIIDMLGK